MKDLKPLVEKVRDAKVALDGARAAYYQAQMDWPTLNGYILAHRKLDRELRSATKKFHSNTERELKKKYVH